MGTTLIVAFFLNGEATAFIALRLVFFLLHLNLVSSTVGVANHVDA